MPDLPIFYSYIPLYLFCINYMINFSLYLLDALKTKKFLQFTKNYKNFIETAFCSYDIPEIQLPLQAYWASDHLHQKLQKRWKAETVQ